MTDGKITKAQKQVLEALQRAGLMRFDRKKGAVSLYVPVSPLPIRSEIDL